MIPLQTGSPHPVSHIVFSPDGSAVAVAQPNTGVTILERASGRTLAVCAMPRRAYLTGLTFSGNGRFVVATHLKGLEVFDATTGAPVLRNFHYPQRLQLAVIGDVVLGAPVKNYTALYPVLKATDEGIADARGRSLLAPNSLELVTCAPDGSHVLSADRNRYLLWHVASGIVVSEFELPADEPPAERVVRFCPLGKRFVVNDGSTLDVYEASGLAAESEEEEQQADIPLVQRANGTQTAVAVEIAPMPHTLLSPVFALKPEKPRESGWYPPFALLADGRGLLVKRPRNRIQLWDAPTGRLVNEWSWRFEWVTCVAVSADGCTAVAGGRFGRVLLWDLE